MLIDILKLQGVRTVYGGVTLPNSKSEALQKSLGFQPVGIFRNAGYKAGRWHDVMWLEMQIAPYNDQPRPLLPVGAIRHERLREIFSAYEYSCPLNCHTWP